jgi:hypothetical protein
MARMEDLGHNLALTVCFPISIISAAQRGISGNKDFGCDAIIVSGARKDEDAKSKDSFSSFDYWAETSVGGRSMLTSMVQKNPIRVFRSSVLQNPYKAQASTEKHKKNKPAIYRYDGLYLVTKVSFLDGESLYGPMVAGRPYCFRLKRVSTGPDPNKNGMGDDELITYCRMQGTMHPL